MSPHELCHTEPNVLDEITLYSCTGHTALTSLTLSPQSILRHTLLFEIFTLSMIFMSKLLGEYPIDPLLTRQREVQMINQL